MGFMDIVFGVFSLLGDMAGGENGAEMKSMVDENRLNYNLQKGYRTVESLRMKLENTENPDEQQNIEEEIRAAKKEMISILHEQYRRASDMETRISIQEEAKSINDL